MTKHESIKEWFFGVVDCWASTEDELTQQMQLTLRRTENGASLTLRKGNQTCAFEVNAILIGSSPVSFPPREQGALDVANVIRAMHGVG